MALAASIARPRLGIVNAKFTSTGGNLSFRQMGERTKQGNTGESSRFGSTAHRLYKLRPAVRINSVVASVIGHHHMFQSPALSHSDGYAKHDAVAERHDGRLHIVLVIMSFRNGVIALQERAVEVLVHKLQGNDDVLYAKPLAVQPCKGQLAAVVVRAVIERQRQRYPVLLVVQQRCGIHAAAKDNDGVFYHNQKL